MSNTRYMISSDPVDYGEHCVDGFACAEEIHVQLDRYAIAHDLDVEFEIVGQIVSLGNKSTGNPEIIADLDMIRERCWATWAPVSAFEF